MKAFATLALLLLHSAVLLRAAPPTSRAAEAHCAFTDEVFMTVMNVSTLAAEHYLIHHRWPQSRAELRSQALRQNTRHETDEFFARFSRLDLQPQGGDLRLDVSFRVSGQVRSQSIVLHPGKSADAILQAATEPPAT